MPILKLSNGTNKNNQPCLVPGSGCRDLTINANVMVGGTPQPPRPPLPSADNPDKSASTKNVIKKLLCKLVENASNWMSLKQINCSLENLKKILMKTCPLFVEIENKIFFELMNKRYPLSLAVLKSDHEAVEVIFNSSLLLEAEKEITAAIGQASFYKSDQEDDSSDSEIESEGEHVYNAMCSVGIKNITACTHLEQGQYDHCPHCFLNTSVQRKNAILNNERVYNSSYQVKTEQIHKISDGRYS